MAAVRMLFMASLLVSAFNFNNGTKRKKTELLSDICSTAFSEQDNKTREEYYNRVRDPNKHISTRLVRYFTFGGILQAISELTGIPRVELVAGGSSQLQDKTSGLGGMKHAAHIIRVGTISRKLMDANESLNRALENYIGHTQNVLRDVNVWSGIGGALDRYQSSNLTVLAKVNFNGTLCDNRDRIVAVATPFHQIITQYVLKKTSEDKGEEKKLEDDKVTGFLIGPAMLFEHGTMGYRMAMNGTFEAHYKRRQQAKKRLRDHSCKLEEQFALGLVRYFTSGGILEAISEKPGISRSKLVTAGGASQVEDRSSGLENSIHAVARIIRVGAIDYRLETVGEPLLRTRQNQIEL
uniref:Hyp37.3 putative secreted salivary gland protein n=1 Tax=Anopheles stephensi TaxID=30069 RepID=Q86M92_ANOST|nr:hyp37.3 putative secreted salivary gland protein [Anopheles stephensi]